MVPGPLDRLAACTLRAGILRIDALNGPGIPEKCKVSPQGKWPRYICGTGLRFVQFQNISIVDHRDKQLLSNGFP